LTPGLTHQKQGIPQQDLILLSNYAQEKNIIILFRPVELIAKSLHEEKKYPTKDFNIKGKSASWGAWAGFIPIDQAYSKLVSARIDQIQKYNKNVQDCIKQGHAIATDLRITKKRYQELVALGIIIPQHQKRENAFTALHCPIPNQDRFQLCYAKEITATSEYAIYTAEKESFQVLADIYLKRPLIPDFDLLAIFNPWEDFGRENIRPNPDVSYEKRLRKLSIREQTYVETKEDFYARELPNLGNITQQTLKKIHQMNDALNKGAHLQCIHHNDDAGSPASSPTLNYPITVLLPQHFEIFTSNLLLIETPKDFVYFIDKISPLGYRVEVNPLWEEAIQFAAKKSFNQKKVFFDLNQKKKLNGAMVISLHEMLTAIGCATDKTLMHEITRIFELIIKTQINVKLEHLFEVIQVCLMLDTRLLSLWCLGIELLVTKKLVMENILSNYLQFLSDLKNETSRFSKIVQALNSINNTKRDQLESSADLEKIPPSLSSR
jgi:hypothetical protein